MIIPKMVASFSACIMHAGIGTYLEEMLLHHGLFDDSPHTRADIWAFARLRMLRITADLKVRRAFLCRQK